MFSKKILVVGAFVGLNVILPVQSFAQSAAAPVTLETAQTTEEKQAAIDLMIEAAGGDLGALTSVVESIARSAPEMSAYAAGKAVMALRTSLGDGSEFAQAAESIASSIAVILASDVTGDNAQFVQATLSSVADTVELASGGLVSGAGVADAMVAAVVASGSTAVTINTLRDSNIETGFILGLNATENVGILRFVVTPPPLGSENSVPVSDTTVGLGVI